MKRHAWAIALAAGCLTALALVAQPAGERRLGFTSEGFVRARKAEAAYAASISTDFISNAHRELTKQPHRSGTAAALETADSVRRTLASAGLEVDVTEYSAYLSEPRDVRVEMTAPEPIAFSLKEASDPRDPDTGHARLDDGFIAYSPSGEVTAPVVYVNYGLPADYARLATAGVDVRGRIVLARYTRSHRAVKVHTAEQAGAAAVILYSDPADDGYMRGEVWPDGLWRPGQFLQRGNAKYSWFWHGDPLTPGVAATADRKTIDPATAPTLPRIPVAVITAHDAEQILRRLSGRAVPTGFQGAMPFTYHTGPGPATVHLRVQMEAGRKPIRNVVGRLTGVAQPDRWVMLGTHHDAWTFGGIDPGSSAAVLLEVARGLGALRKTGWQPRRSIVFAFWDAEEYGLVGSTEFAEARARELQERAVVYINSDMYTAGRFVAGGVPSLRDFVIEVARDVPEGKGTLYDRWRSSEWSRQSVERRRQGSSGFEVDLSLLGSGADFVAFQDYLGLPSLALEFQFEGGYGFGAYHSSYDTRAYMERLVDPGFRRGAELARVIGTSVMRLASADVLPFRYSYYATRIRSYIDDARGWAIDDEGRQKVAVDVGDLQKLAAALATRAQAVEQKLDAALAAGGTPKQIDRINDALMRLEQTLLDSSEPPDKRWYRHVIYGWNIYSMYDGQPLPGLAEAIRLEDPALVKREVERIRAALQRMFEGLDGVAALL